MKKILLILLTFTLINPAFSQGPKPCPKTKEVEAGDSIPCEGVFFNEKAANKLRKKEKEREKLKRDLKLTELQVKNRNEKARVWENEAKRQRELREGEQWAHTKGLLLGIAGTVLMFFVTSEAIERAK